MLKAYADENVSHAVVQSLRKRGMHVATVSDRDRLAVNAAGVPVGREQTGQSDLTLCLGSIDRWRLRGITPKDTMVSMTRTPSFSWPRALAFLAGVLIWKVAISVLIQYRHYIPPDFDSEFLFGREEYFWGVYSWAFYAHLAFGPPSLVLGTLLVSNRFRHWTPKWHRWLGRVQVAGVLLLVAPSGLCMSWHAETGAIAAAGLGSLAIVTAVCAAIGWRTAVRRDFASHRRWMWRTFMLLCSAVVIRSIGGLASVTHFDAEWLYPLTCWISWLVPLLAFESIERLGKSGVFVANTGQ